MSPTFAVDVMCHSLLLAIADAVRGGGYLGIVRMQDSVELLARRER